MNQTYLIYAKSHVLFRRPKLRFEPASYKSKVFLKKYLKKYLIGRKSQAYATISIYIDSKRSSSRS